MRRTLIALLLLAGLLSLAACGNKGPLVRAPAQPDPAPAASVASPTRPAPASSAMSPTRPAPAPAASAMSPAAAATTGATW